MDLGAAHNGVEGKRLVYHYDGDERGSGLYHHK